MLVDEAVHQAFPSLVIAEDPYCFVQTNPELFEEFLAVMDGALLVLQSQRVPAFQRLHQGVEAREESTAEIVGMERGEEPRLHEFNQRIELVRMELHRGGCEQEQPVDE